MGEFVKVAAVCEVPAGSGKVVEVDKKLVALFNVGGHFYALDNTCPHMGGPLGEGSLEGPVVSCPWHGWEFNVITGRSAADGMCIQPCYPVTVDGQGVYVKSQPR